jgi:superfamily II DNA/RNA helicase
MVQYVHRCGRAGRNQKENSKKPPPTAHVFSFFTRELPSPMASSVLSLLREASNAPSIDPKLLKLVAAADAAPPAAAADPDSNDAPPAGEKANTQDDTTTTKKKKKTKK